MKHLPETNDNSPSTGSQPFYSKPNTERIKYLNCHVNYINVPGPVLAKTLSHFFALSIVYKPNLYTVTILTARSSQSDLNYKKKKTRQKEQRFPNEIHVTLMTHETILPGRLIDDVS